MGTWRVSDGLQGVGGAGRVWFFCVQKDTMEIDVDVFGTQRLQQVGTVGNPEVLHLSFRSLALIVLACHPPAPTRWCCLASADPIVRATTWGMYLSHRLMHCMQCVPHVTPDTP